MTTPDAELSALLDRECAGNPALRERIEARLRQLPTVNAPPERAGPIAQKDISTDSHRTSEDQPGEVIAERYKLLQQIGEGGMGTV